jgi:hypothetical protein
MPEMTYRERCAVEAFLRRTIDGIGQRVASVARRLTKAVEQAVEDNVAEHVRGVLDSHKEGAHPDGPYAGYVAAEDDKVAVHHQHHQDDDFHHLTRVAADLGGIKGVCRVRQSANPPVGAQWRKVYGMPPRSEDDQGSGEATMQTKGEDTWFGPWQVSQPARTPIRKSLGANCACCAEEILYGKCRC